MQDETEHPLFVLGGKFNTSSGLSSHALLILDISGEERKVVEQIYILSKNQELDKISDLLEKNPDLTEKSKRFLLLEAIRFD